MKYFTRNDHVINAVSQAEYKKQFGVTFRQVKNCDDEVVGNIKAQEAPCLWDSLNELTGAMVEMLDNDEIADAIAAQVNPRYAEAIRKKAIAAGKFQPLAA